MRSFCGWLEVASGKRVVCEETTTLGKELENIFKSSH